jgi:hypothetical protein
MALVTCYDPEGNQHQKEPVDAKECCKHCGYSMTPPELVAPEKASEAGQNASNEKADAEAEAKAKADVEAKAKPEAKADAKK